MAKLYDWGDGKKVHTISKAEHDKRTQATIDQRTYLRPPPGTYDPNLDAQERASQRGLGDLISDVGQSRERGATDLGLGLTDIGTQRTQLGEDYTGGQAAIERGTGRSLADLLKAREQGTQDYGSNVATLQRNYENLGVAQGEGQRKAGAFGGSGAAIQAARKRDANQAIDRAPIDTAYQRFIDSSKTAETRLGEDKTTSLDDLRTGYGRGINSLDRATGQLGLNYDRSNTDLTTQQSRAERENTNFGIDTAAARVGQYLQNSPTGKLPYIPGAAEAARIAKRKAAAAAKAKGR